MQPAPEKLIFMTDPLCSWCWAMVPELQRLQTRFGERLEFELKCAGLQVGNRMPLTEAHKTRLANLWQEVAETTGQRFAHCLPTDEDFIYHSELACRALEVNRTITDQEPFAYYYRLQKAFYVEARNIADPDVLFDLMADEDCPAIEPAAFFDLMVSESITQALKAGFAWCEERAITALPTLFLDTGSGPTLISGGYATADYLAPELEQRLLTH